MLRRLSSTQVEYYRVAHILLDVEREVTQELYTRGGRRIDLAAMRTGLADAAEWLRGDSYPGPLRAGDVWRVQDVIRELQAKIEVINRYREVAQCRGIENEAGHSPVWNSLRSWSSDRAPGSGRSASLTE